MRTGAESAVGARRHNKNDVIMIIAGLWRYGDWPHVATGCNALVTKQKRSSNFQPGEIPLGYSTSNDKLFTRKYQWHYPHYSQNVEELHPLKHTNNCINMLHNKYNLYVINSTMQKNNYT